MCWLGFWPLSRLRCSVAKTPVAFQLSVSPSLLICCLSTGHTLILWMGFWAIAPRKGFTVPVSEGPIKTDYLFSGGSYAVIVQTAQEASCWEVSWCPSKAGWEEDIQNRWKTCTHSHSYSWVHTVCFKYLIVWYLISKISVWWAVCLSAIIFCQRHILLSLEWKARQRRDNYTTMVLHSTVDYKVVFS